VTDSQNSLGNLFEVLKVVIDIVNGNLDLQASDLESLFLNRKVLDIGGLTTQKLFEVRVLGLCT
jgi:hypothetical protein